MSQGALLLVDDDRQVLESMADWLRDQGFELDATDSYQAAVAELDSKTYDLLLVDIRLSDGDGMDILDVCREKCPQTSVILITGYGTVDMAVDAIRGGAFDFVTKPLIDEELLMSIERALAQREVIQENNNLRKQLDLRFGIDNIVGRDPKMLQIFDMIESIADTKATVLLTGESGTGKSLVARAVHRRSDRSSGPFVEVACGALPENLLESELFGHVAGAFTGATGDKIGKFKLADGGTIFLDEIGTASPAMQVKLLRVLQELQFEPVGGTETDSVDVRVILATNEDLHTRGQRRTIPSGPVLSSQRHQHRDPAAPRTARRHPAPRARLPRKSRRRVGPIGSGLHRRGDRFATTLSLARKRPRAAERCRTGGPARQGASDRDR